VIDLPMLLLSLCSRKYAWLQCQHSDLNAEHKMDSDFKTVALDNSRDFLGAFPKFLLNSNLCTMICVE
jgi:hypothetical protein